MMGSLLHACLGSHLLMTDLPVQHSDVVCDMSSIRSFRVGRCAFRIRIFIESLCWKTTDPFPQVGRMNALLDKCEHMRKDHKHGTSKFFLS